MKQFRVLGSGCASCKQTMAMIEQVAAQRGVAIGLEKVESLQQIVAYGVLSTPAVVLDGVVVHAGGIPAREQVEQWLA
ncbi:thioredoxin family protein [Mariprofundus erugo]|uniref:Thioredoxin family protein n=1 Tax=Mariprofundus erugo TaxID=2528639 RepID=A0A5R9GLX6_9PROT|nr:thioredoxin family protein [Mariprofundus erugo]TLS66135.1 thioredoxin family protein [Mariprofundus erugo]